MTASYWRNAPLACCALLAATPTAAQNDVPDTPLIIPAVVGAFVPDGWKAIALEQGDLLGSSAVEYVLVIQQTDPDNIIKNDNLGMPELDTNPRRLIILSNTTRAYRIISETSTFLPPQNDAESSCLADPLLEEGSVAIARKTLTISLGYWLSCGSYGVTRRTYRFAWNGTKMRLTGLDGLSFSRSSGEGEETSINFLTGRKKTTTNMQIIGPDDTDPPVPKPKIRWTNMRVKRYFLENMNQAACENYDAAPMWCGNT